MRQRIFVHLPSFTGSKVVCICKLHKKDLPALIELFMSQSRFRLMVDVF